MRSAVKTSIKDKVKIVYADPTPGELAIKALCDELEIARLQLQHNLTLHTKYLNDVTNTKE